MPDAERAGGSLKAIGSGWSDSGAEVDDSTTHVINTDLLTGILSSTSISNPPTALIPFALKDDLQPRARYFVEVKAGTKVHDLNCLLDAMKDSNGVGLAMRTLGGSNGQSIAGAISTGTHGADVNMQPIADSIYAIHLVGPGGKNGGSSAMATDPSPTRTGCNGRASCNLYAPTSALSTTHHCFARRSPGYEQQIWPVSI